MIDKTTEYYKQFETAIIQADIVKVFDYLLTIGVNAGASDIHIEPYANYCRVRLRVDWLLEELIQYPTNIHESIIAKFKIESWQMRPDEKRIPQDARVSSATLEWKEIDLRANTLPTVQWEKLVMRIVDKSKKIPELKVLWIEWINHDLLFNSLHLPNGIILTTWPTWSWKSTTLYAWLSYLNVPTENITTYEDPVENKMDWLNQSQVRADIWYTFSQWLRAALRQDPDIIMVWEIRDWETLETAMEAAMTWHLVFSTIHANSASETITRIVNMWAQPFMIAGTFNLVMAQRLGRKICDDCKVQYNLKENEPKIYSNMVKSLKTMWDDKLKNEIILRKIPKENWENFIKEWKIYKWSWKNPKSWEVCGTCGWCGCKWRVGIYEFMDFSDEIRQYILSWKSAFELDKYAMSKWMVNLERDGVFKSMKWLISAEELYRLTKHKDI